MKKLFLIIMSSIMIISCEKEELDNSIISTNSIAKISSSCDLFMENPITTIESTFSNINGGTSTCNNPIFNTCFGVRLGRVLRTEFNRRRSQIGQFAFREILDVEQVDSNAIDFIPISDMDEVEPNIDIGVEISIDLANKIYRQIACDIHTHYNSLPVLTNPNQVYFLNINDISINIPFGNSETDNAEFSMTYSIQKRTYSN